MSRDFTPEPSVPDPIPISDRQNVAESGGADTEAGNPPEINVPAKLMPKRPPIFFWIGIALLLGALVALVLVGLWSD
jgi:hypothetical protein